MAIKIGGEAGFGIKAAGLILGKALFQSGAEIFGYSEYPSLIRGGHNTYQMNVANEPISSTTKRVDILIALDKKTIEADMKYLTDDGAVIFDGALEQRDKRLINLPLMELSKKAGGVIARNMVALGAGAYLVGLELSKLEEQVEKNFKNKGAEVLTMNRQAVELGYNFLKDKKVKKETDLAEWSLKSRNKSDIIATANEATAEGMIWAGCKFYAAYPMTPATSIMHILAERQREEGLVVHQTEDEISAIGAAIGASVAGVRAATGTSGGGFSLMVEHLGLAAITETPLVVVESQRTGPATGLPTWTEQSDLKFIINASHGEFPRMVIAPGDAKEAAEMIQQAFSWAEEWQVPVIFILDKYLSESDFVWLDWESKKMAVKRVGFISDKELENLDNYKRYEITGSGVSKRAVPGQKGRVGVINSDDHDEYGFSTDESEERIKMMDKRFSKVKNMEAELPEPKLYGPESAEVTIVGWGSVKGPILDAMQEIRKSRNQVRQLPDLDIPSSGGRIALGAKNSKVNFLHLNYLWPFPGRRVKAVLEKAKKVLLVENNKTGQLGDLIREQTGIEIKNRFLKYDGRPFFREEIVEKINSLIIQ